MGEPRQPDQESDGRSRHRDRRQVRRLRGLLQVASTRRWPTAASPTTSGSSSTTSTPRRSRATSTPTSSSAPTRSSSRAGFGRRGVEGMMRAIRYAREKKVPFFGICLGLQTAVIEYARNVAGLEGANSTEFEEEPAAQGHLQAARPDRRRGARRDDAPRQVPLRALPGLLRRARLRREPHLGAPPPPLRGQPGVPAAAQGGRPLVHGDVSRQEVRRDHRAPRRPSVVPGLPVPPGARSPSPSPVTRSSRTSSGRPAPTGRHPKDETPKPRNAVSSAAEPS